MKITFYDRQVMLDFVATIKESYFSEPFELFGQLVMMASYEVTQRKDGMSVVEIDLVEVA